VLELGRKGMGQKGGTGQLGGAGPKGREKGRVADLARLHVERGSGEGLARVRQPNHADGMVSGGTVGGGRSCA
jgi:hypothetical protein